VSHPHMDHAKCVVDAAKAGVDVFLSQGSALELNASGHRIHHVVSGKLFSVGEWQVMPFDVVHDCKEPFGFLIANGTDRVLFITDSAYSPKKFKDVSHLIIEANYSEKILKDRLERGEIDQFRVDRLVRSHMSIERVKELIGANSWPGLKEVHLIHLSDGNSDEELFKSEIQKLTGVPVFVAGK